jgi:signal transduction histidine kinase
MRQRMTTLRLRLVIGFLLVSVPAMLASAYVAARLISNAFESNVEQWMGETSRFFKLEVREATREAQRVANVVGQRVENASEDELRHPASIEKDLAILGSVGYDLIAIYGDDQERLFESRPFTAKGSLPTDMRRGIFQIETEGRHYIMAGAVQPVRVLGRKANILVGTWLDDAYLGSIKVVTSLDVRLFADTGSGGFEPVLLTHPGPTPPKPVPDAVRARLAAGNETVFDRQADDGGYRAIYTGFRGIDGNLVAVAFIGLANREGFFEQIGRWRLFVGIFLFGSALSVLVGGAMSGILVGPLRALTRGVRAITSGDYQQRVPARGGREVAELAAGFNAMAEQLGRVHALEEELRRRDRLSALGQAAMVIAHEVRNPLGIIKTSTEVVRNRARLGPSEDRMLGYVIDEVRRIETLVRDFLDFAQPKEPSRTIVPLRSVVDRVASFAAPEFAKLGITLEIADEAPGVMISGDPDQLHQACLNLVLNAIDAMQGGGRIAIKLSATPAQAVLTIADSGTGVPAEIASEIFSPFFTTKARGTGLGLAKVQSVAAAHGGTVSCVSEPGQGAAFTLTLPRVDKGDPA